VAETCLPSLHGRSSFAASLQPPVVSCLVMILAFPVRLIFRVSLSLRFKH
jgi:hypothetical protein